MPYVAHTRIAIVGCLGAQIITRQKQRLEHELAALAQCRLQLREMAKGAALVVQHSHRERRIEDLVGRRRLFEPARQDENSGVPGEYVDCEKLHSEQQGRVDANDGGCAGLAHLKRVVTIARTDVGGEGGTVTFATSGKSTEIDGATTLLEAGEELGIQMPFGCRMGICQTCVVPLAGGYVRDLRSGDERREGDRIQTCISTVSGECTLDL